MTVSQIEIRLEPGDDRPGFDPSDKHSGLFQQVPLSSGVLPVFFVMLAM